MTDYFALFEEPRLPWPDISVLEKKFLTQSTHLHPNRFHQASQEEKKTAEERYTEWNQAYQCLKNPKDRVLHLLRLETGRSPSEVMSIPHDTTDLFMEVGESCRTTDQFLKEREGVNSPMLKVQWFEKSQEKMERLQVTRDKLESWKEGLCQRLQNMNEAWSLAQAMSAQERSKTLPLEDLEQIYRLLSYADRWTAQVQERLFQLTAL